MFQSKFSYDRVSIFEYKYLDMYISASCDNYN